MHRSLDISVSRPTRTFDKLNNITYENNEFRLSFTGEGSVYWSDIILSHATVTLAGGVVKVGIVGQESQWAADFVPDAFVGGIGNDVVVGNNVDNMIFAGAGNDTLTGGKGNDILNGGAGNNTYIFSKGDGVDKLVASYAAGSVQTIRFTDVSSEEVNYTIEKGALTIHYGNNAEDKITINDFLVENQDHFVFEFTDKTIAAADVNSTVGIQYWVDTLVAAASVNYATNMYYAYPTTPPNYLTEKDLLEWQPADATLKAIFETQLNQFERYTNLTFTYTENVNQVNVLALHINEQQANGSAGYAYYPSNYPRSSDVFMDDDYAKNINYANLSVAHEIGHAVGMPHPHSGSAADADTSDIPPSWATTENSREWTMMSYKGPVYTGDQIFRDFDISALQALYGVNANYNSGNDVYRFNSTKGVLIGDGAGWDQINASTADKAAYINLNQGAWSYLGASKAEHISTANQMHINIGTHIEDAIGSNFNDTLIGNMGNNYLVGGLGADIMKGGFGNDIYDVDNVNDQVIEFDGQGYDTVYSTVSYQLSDFVERLILQGSANLSATGNSSSNYLIGNSGNNILDGGAGADRLEGGLGDDTYYVDTIGDQIIENANEGTDRVISSVDYSLAPYAHVEEIQLAGTANINATGNALDNLLIGNTGNNILDGGLGADRMEGGLGDDTYYVNDYWDNPIELANQGNDTIITTSAEYNSLAWTANIENLTLAAGSDARNAYGNNLNNILTGNEFSNVLDGGLGADFMIGGLGNDHYYVDNINDQILEYADEGYDWVYTSVNYTLSTHTEGLYLLGTSNINATGNSVSNRLIGNVGNNILDGGAGADRMEGGKGDDIYYVDNIYDEVIELNGEGNDLIYSTVSYTLAATTYVETLQLIGSSHINATGNSQNNILIGNAGNNILNGGAGADRMEGGLGNDIYYVDNVNDKVIELAGEGTDTIYTSISLNLGSFAQNVENGVLTGSANLNLTGSSADNRLFGNSGNNTLNGGLGADYMQGGLGNDVYYVDNANDQVIEYAGEGTDTIYTTINLNLSTFAQHVENAVITGTANRSLTGNSLDNTLTGNSGNNTLNGGLGADIMIGGKGDDIYYVDNVNDQVVERANEGTDTVVASVSYSLAGSYIEKLSLSGTENINATGNSVDNILTGNEGNNIINGGLGADIMTGGKGDDTYYVDNVNDQVVERNGEGIDTVYTTVSYTLAGSYIENLILQGVGNLNATGNSVDNILTGNHGNNILDGGLGGDIMAGGRGDDIYYVDNRKDQVIERANEGNDTVYSSVSYTLNGTYIENLYLTGVNANNATGNSQANNLVGNSANNILNGMGGTDILTGGLGSDTAMYKLLTKNDATGGNGSDVWTDFVVGQVGVNANADQINIKDLLVGFNGNGTLVNLENYLTVTSSGSDTNIYIDRDGGKSAYTDSLLLTLQNVNTTLDELVRNNQFVV